MSLGIVHLSSTPLAGAPIRIVRALQAHTPYDVRLVDLVRTNLYDQDLVHGDDPDRTVELCRKADVIHLYNYLDYNSRQFESLDFEDLRRRGKRFVRHFESTPMRVAAHMKLDVSQVMTCPIPKLVIAQYPERFLPTARVVPNIIPQNDPEYLPRQEALGHEVLYTPTWENSAWDSRWDTKGMPETIEMLERVRSRVACRVKCLYRQPLKTIMKEKRRSAILIDELITGSYHLSGLEGLSLGKPTLAYLDSRTERVLRAISGSLECPFINARLEDAEELLVELLWAPEAMAEIGVASRAWLENFWQDHVLVRHFVNVYEELMENPENIKRQDDLRIDGPANRFLSISVPDAIYQARSNAMKPEAQQRGQDKAA